jgi:hypothetical protein
VHSIYLKFETNLLSSVSCSWKVREVFRITSKLHIYVDCILNLLSSRPLLVFTELVRGLEAVTSNFELPSCAGFAEPLSLQAVAIVSDVREVVRNHLELCTASVWRTFATSLTSRLV